MQTPALELRCIVGGRKGREGPREARVKRGGCIKSSDLLCMVVSGYEVNLDFVLLKTGEKMGRSWDIGKKTHSFVKLSPSTKDLDLKPPKLQVKNQRLWQNQVQFSIIFICASV